MSSKQKKQCNLLTLRQRFDILKKLEKGVKINALSLEYGVNSLTIRRIQANKTEIQHRITVNSGSRKIIRKPHLEELDSVLHTWFLEALAKGERVTNAAIIAKANELCIKNGGPATFNANKGWVWRFKKRYNIHVGNISGENADTDTLSAEAFIKQFKTLLEEENIKPNHIYNMDETVLMWKAIPQKTLIGPTEVIFGNKMKKEWVSIGLCANATGTHKLLPLFIHKYEKPRAFKHIKVHELPVVYKYQKNACIDSNIFANWLENHFKHEVKKHQLENKTSGKILLLVDNCRSHCVETTIRKLKDENIEIIFLPVTCTSSLQPMQQGLIAKLKRCFRQRMLENILDLPRRIIEFYLDYDIKDCINILHDTWTIISPDNIRNSWKKLLQGKATVGDVLDCNSEIFDIAETVQRISLQQTTDTEIAKWLSICEEEENQIQANQDVEIKCNKNCNPLPSEEEMDRTFANLFVWSKNKAQCIQMHVATLEGCYEQECIDKASKPL